MAGTRTEEMDINEVITMIARHATRSNRLR